MKIKLENIFGITKEQINIPLIIEEIPMGVVTDVTNEEVTVLLWDRFITMDSDINFNNKEEKITAIHIKREFSSSQALNSWAMKEQ